MRQQMLEVLTPGPLTTVQDAGRPGYAAYGVPRSGAFDRGALRTANRLVGNPADAAALEITLGGFTMRARSAVTIALTGAPCPGLDWGSALTLPVGATVRLAPPRTGLRSYLAVRGGIDVPAELGSRSTDTLGGIGPAVVRGGDLLPIGPQPDPAPDGTSAVPLRPPDRLRVVAGPRADWLTADAWTTLTTAVWTLRADSDRVGVRLSGPLLTRTRGDELPSEPTLPGAIQVPPDGQPIVFGPDAPVTGGYPVLAVVGAGADFDALAQLRPGDQFRFRADGEPLGSRVGAPRTR